MDCGAASCGSGTSTPAVTNPACVQPPPPPPAEWDVQDSRLNIAYPKPGQLSNAFSKFALNGPITIGGRSDHNAHRHFLGGIRSVSIYASALSKAEVNCIFTHDDAQFSGALPASSNGAATARPQAGALAVLAAALVLIR